MMKKKKGCLHIVKWIFLGFAVLLILLLGGLYLHNRTLPEASKEVAALEGSDRILLEEADHLRRSLGDHVWPGWDTLDIPLVVYNEAYVFLLGMDEPAAGWKRVPRTGVEGGSWNRMEGKDYFRQPLPDNGPTPQAFIVQIGERYAASMTTREWTGVKMVRQIRKELPDFLGPVFPYGLILSQFNSDWYVSALLHESFHVLQAIAAKGKVNSAETATSLEREYPWDDPDFRSAWLEERRMLSEAVQTEDSAKLAELARRWLAHRKERRQNLDEQLVRYEQQREWLEGLAKYAELMIGKLAAESDEYEPVPQTAEVSDFNRYEGAANHWQREVGQLQSDLQFDATIFYYSGWAQAVLLDRLRPGWKVNAMQPDTFLEDLFTL